MSDQLTALTNAGFQSISPIIHPRIIASIWGHDGFGKTHFAFSAPGPIALFNFDIGHEGVVHKFTSQKEIREIQITVPRDSDNCKKEADDLWIKFNTTYDIALSNARTIIVDTATELWALLRLARFGKLTQVMPYQYTPVNAEFSSIIKRAFDAVGTNVIFLHRARAIYINDKNTGKYEQSGFSGMFYDVQLRGQMQRWDPDAEHSTVQFGITIEKSRHNPALIGQTFTGSMATFPMIAQMAIAGTKAEDWT